MKAPAAGDPLIWLLTALAALLAVDAPPPAADDDGRQLALALHAWIAWPMVALCTLLALLSLVADVGGDDAAAMALWHAGVALALAVSARLFRAVLRPPTDPQDLGAADRRAMLRVGHGLTLLGLAGAPRLLDLWTTAVAPWPPDAAPPGPAYVWVPLLLATLQALGVHGGSRLTTALRCGLIGAAVLQA